MLTKVIKPLSSKSNADSASFTKDYPRRKYKSTFKSQEPAAELKFDSEIFRTETIKEVSEMSQSDSTPANKSIDGPVPEESPFNIKSRLNKDLSGFTQSSNESQSQDSNQNLSNRSCHNEEEKVGVTNYSFKMSQSKALMSKSEEKVNIKKKIDQPKNRQSLYMKHRRRMTVQKPEIDFNKSVMCERHQKHMTSDSPSKKADPEWTFDSKDSQKKLMSKQFDRRATPKNRNTSLKKLYGLCKCILLIQI